MFPSCWPSRPGCPPAGDPDMVHAQGWVMAPTARNLSTAMGLPCFSSRGGRLIIARFLADEELPQAPQICIFPSKCSCRRQKNGCDIGDTHVAVSVRLPCGFINWAQLPALAPAVPMWQWPQRRAVHMKVGGEPRRLRGPHSRVAVGSSVPSIKQLVAVPP